MTVFVNQTTKDLGPPDGSADVGTIEADVTDGWQLLQRAMRAVCVVVVLILGQHVSELLFVENQHPVQALSTDGADPPLGVGVGLRRTRRTTQHRDAGISEHGIEAFGELRVSIADQEPETSARSPSAYMRLRACWVTHSPVGCRVTPRMWTLRVPTSRTKNT